MAIQDRLQLNTPVPRDLYDKVAAEARRRLTSKADITREALLVYFKDGKGQE